MGLPPNWKEEIRLASISNCFLNPRNRVSHLSMRHRGYGRKTIEDETYLRNQDLIAGADTHGEAAALLGQETGANGEDLGLVLLLNAALGEEDAGGGLGLGLDALDQNAVKEGSKALDVAEDRLLRSELIYCASKGRVLCG
jgi:hypothetical protein